MNAGFRFKLFLLSTTNLQGLGYDYTTLLYFFCYYVSPQTLLHLHTPSSTTLLSVTMTILISDSLFL